MTVQIQYNQSPVFKVYPGSSINIIYTPEKTSSTGSAPTQNDAYVNDIDPAASAVAGENPPNAPLSQAEIDQLYSVYTELGSSHPAWEEIQDLLILELAGNDRTNFLSALAQAEEHITGFVEQVSRLEGEARSLFLTTAVRTGSGQNLENLIDAVKHLDSDQLERFFETADSLGRTPESLNAGELQNFIAAVAGNPGQLDNLVDRMSDLDEEDRALFLEAAAGAEDELADFVATSHLLSGKDLTRFLESATVAGDGLTHLLSLTRDLNGEARSDFLNFTANLTSDNTDLFLTATQGDKERLSELKATALSLSGEARSNFLTLAADAGNDLDRLSQMVNSLAENPALRADFLATAIHAEDHFDGFLSIAEKLNSADQAKLFAFSASLGYTDLTNFISAARDNASQAIELADTAQSLDGKNKSYLLYAASLAPEHISELTAVTQTLNGQELSDFLFTAANTPGSSDETDGAPGSGAMKELLQATRQLTGKEREDFLARERINASQDGTQRLAKEYVFLKSVFDAGTFEDVMHTGKDIETVLEDFDRMDAVQRDNFFSVVNKTDQAVLPELVSVMSRLDEERSNDFLDYANTLGKESITHLVRAADNALGSDGIYTQTFDRLMDTAQSLDPEVDEQFLKAAAHAGDSLDNLMDLTREFTGFLQADFLSIAGTMTEYGKETLDNFLATTRQLIDEGYMTTPATASARTGGIRPSDLIRDGEFQGSLPMEGFFKSTLFLIGVGIDGSHMNEWFNSWQGIPRME